MSITINIQKKKYSGSIHFSDNKYTIESNNFLFYRTLDGAMRRFWKNGVGAVQGSHGTEGRAIQLRNVVYTKEDTEFINATIRFFRRMFGPEAVSLKSDKAELREKKNQIRRKLNKYISLPGAATALQEINTVLEKTTPEQVDILYNDIR